MNTAMLISNFTFYIKVAPVPTDYRWYVGITNNKESRRAQHEAEGKSTKYWSAEIADSLSVAREVESHFLEKMGFDGGVGGDLDPQKSVYVYVF